MNNSTLEINHIGWKDLSFYNPLGNILIIGPIIIVFVFGPLISFIEAGGLNIDFFIYLIIIICIGLLLIRYCYYFGQTLINERANHYGKDFPKTKTKEIIQIITTILKNNKIKYIKNLNVKISNIFLYYDAIFDISDKNFKIKIENDGKNTFISIGKITELNQGIIENLKKKIDETLALELDN